MNIRDLAERVFWTGVAGAVAAASEIHFELGPLWTPVVAGAVTAALVWVRKHLPVLPDPGAGLPGLPTETAKEAA